MFEDNFGRRFYYLRLSITEICNFRCTYCLPDGYRGDGPSAFLSRDELRRVMRVFAAQGTRKIRLTGGEPGIRPDLPELIADARSTEGIEEVAITSNGYRLPQQIDTWHAAGLDRLNLSMDSLDPRQFHSITGHDRLQEVLQGLERALALGIRTKINLVWMRGVNNNLSGLLDWLKSTPVTLRLIEVMETGAQPDFFERHHESLGPIQQQLLLESWSPIRRPVHAGPAEELSHPDYAGRIGLIRPYSTGFCDTCNRLRISARGRLHLCLFGEKGYDLRPWLQSDAQEEALADHIRDVLGEKKATHGLHEHNPGITRDLSMLGG